MELSTPIHVHWEITGACNLRCLHCYQQDDRIRLKFLGKNNLFIIAKKLVNGGVFQVTLSGGEPFLVDCLQHLVKYLNNNGIIPQISSNGTLIDRTAIAWLTSVQAKIQISLDSKKPKVHDYIRQHEGAFNLALEAIDLLQGHDVPVCIAFCANRLNFADVEGVIRLAIDKGIGVLAIGEIMPLWGEYRDELAFTPVEYQRFIDTVVSLRQEYSNYIDIQFISEWGFLYSDTVEHNPCTAMDRDMAILYDGSVSPCPFIRHESYRMGNLLTSDLDQVWQSEAAKRFRAQKHMGCNSTCPYSATCMGGCKAPLANKGMSIAQASASCPLLKHAVSFQDQEG
jgi:radical SAM protein with 4Fe4S-binding SPASM domain